MSGHPRTLGAGKLLGKSDFMAERETLSESHVSRALEVSIRVGLLILLTAACLLILRPFIPLIAWGIIIAIATYPAHRRLQNAFRGRPSLCAGAWRGVF